MNANTRFFSDVLKLGLGILLGFLMLWAVAEYRANYLTLKLEKQLQAEMQAQAARSEQRRQDRERHRRWSAEQQQSLQRAAESDKRKRIEDEQRKQEAWDRYYNPAPECLVAVSVECGNAHIRARREFEKLYASGQL